MKWRVSVVGEGVRLQGELEDDLELTGLTRAVAPMGWLVVVSPMEEEQEQACGN